MNPILRTRYGITNKRPIVALAPMAGVTDLPFRSLCEQLGADYSVTEMAASAPQLLHSAKNQSRRQFPANSHVNILQIIGNDARQMAEVACYYADNGADIIDINLGCPARKINRKGAGSALLSDLSTVKTILTTVSKACPVPVTLKTRLGPNHAHYTLATVADIATDVGIELITVHGRTRDCQFNGSAQFDEIARVKQRYPQLAMIANGDIDSVERAHKVLTATQCDGIMIGRGAVGNPWLFSDIRQSWDADFKVKKDSHIEQILTHVSQIHKFYGADKGVRFARKHIQKYLAHRQLGHYFSQLSHIENADEQRRHLKLLLTTTHPRPTMQKKPKKAKVEKAIRRLVKQYFNHIDDSCEMGCLHPELIRRVERELIRQVLKETSDNQSQAAKILGLSRTTLRKKMVDFDL